MFCIIYLESATSMGGGCGAISPHRGDVFIALGFNPGFIKGILDRPNYPSISRGTVTSAVKIKIEFFPPRVSILGHCGCSTAKHRVPFRSDKQF